MLNMLTVNLGPPMSLTERGREYIVSSVVMIVPGVLHGTSGRLYYPPAGLAAAAPKWDRIPVTLGHPRVGNTYVAVNSREGRRVTVRLGEVRSPAFRSGRLVASAWLDTRAVGKASPALLRRIRAGERVEVSTGLAAIELDDPPPGVDAWGTVLNHQPDHLAILTDSPGACSVQAGCGLNNSLEAAEAFFRDVLAMVRAAAANQAPAPPVNVPALRSPVWSS